MLNAQLAEFEQSFRRSWRGYSPSSYASYLEQVEASERPSLLARLLSVELEYAYQPPQLLGEEDGIGSDDDDERVKPRLQLFLLRFPELTKHREVMVQLAMLEFALRLRFDSEPPSYESYLELCPNEKERLGDMLEMMESKLCNVVRSPLNTTPAGLHDTTVTEGKAERPLSLTQLPSSLGYFLLIDVIGQGGMGTVYAAVDLRSAAHVAVKLIRRIDSWSVYRFIEEFTWLANLSHPNVVKLYDTFCEGELRYFSMELVEGLAIRDWYKSIRDKSNAWQRLRGVLSQAALAVSFLHDHGVVHRDIKSSNLMVTHRDKAVLLDLGLASRAHQDQSTTRKIDGEQIIGTLPYLPPEALEHGPPSFAGDWYSFGVMIFEALTGEFPPSRVDPQSLTSRDEAARDLPAEIRSKLIDCPEDLRELCVQLLQQNPMDRPSAGVIMEMLGSDLGQPIAFHVTDADFTGREDGLEFLSQGFADAQSGTNAIRLLRGESGVGKTTLLQHWRKSHTPESAALWLMIRCRNQDHTPLRALNLLVQEMVTELSKHPSELWIDLARGGGEEVVHSFPQVERLSEADWPVPSAVNDPVEASARRAVGLHALLGWLKGLSQRRPLIIAIDDAHWADAESGRIFSHLFRTDSDFRGMLILVDQGSNVESPFLQMILKSCHDPAQIVATHELKPLHSSECESLIERWSKRLKIGVSQAAIEDMIRRSGGSPFLLQELFRSYVNYVVRHKLSDQSWFADNAQSEGVLHRRFSMLSPSTEKVLQFLAVSDTALGIHQLQTATRILPAQLIAELNHLSGQGWIRWSGGTADSEVEISHERFRTVVVQSMLDDRRQRRHYRLARMLSAEVPPPWARIAHHYSEARHFREAAACYMEGARAAARHLSFPEALWLLELAFHPLAQRTSQEIRDAKRLKADCLAGNGSSALAAEEYHALALSSNSEQESMLLQCLAGEQWIRSGKLRIGVESARSALQYLQINPDDHSWWQQKQDWIRAARLAHTSPPISNNPENLPPLTPIEQVLNRLSGPLSFLDNQLGVRLTLRMIKLVRNRGTAQDRAIAMMRWGIVLAYSKRKLRQRALLWIRAAHSLTRGTQSANVRALHHVSMFIFHSLQGRFRDAQRFGRRAERLYQSHHASDTWETGFVCWISLNHLWHLGELEELCQKTLTYRQDASRRTDTMWTYWMHVNAAHITDLIHDDVQQGRQSLSMAADVIRDECSGTPQTILWISHIRQLLYENRPTDALELLQSQWIKVQSSGFFNIASYSWAALCLRACCHLACASQNPRLARTHLQASRATVKRLQQLEEPTFLLYARALELVIDAYEEKPAHASYWTQLIEEVDREHLGLLKLGLQWHRAIHSEYGLDDPGELSGSEAPNAVIGRQAFLEQGVVNPEQLMNLILPLPNRTQSKRGPSSAD